MLTRILPIAVTAAVLSSYATASNACNDSMCAIAEGGQPVMPSQIAATEEKNTEAGGITALDKEIDRYLDAHPEVVEKALLTLRAKREATAVALQTNTFKDDSNSIYHHPMDGTAGAADGDVTIVEFFDNQCPICKGFQPIIDRLLAEDPHVHLVLKEYVLTQGLNGPLFMSIGSILSAKAGLAVRKYQGNDVYVRFHQGLMKDKTEERHLEMPRIEEIARATGVDVDLMKQHMNDPDIDHHISDTQHLAYNLRINGTPSVIIGDRVIGDRSLENLRKAIADVRAQRNTAAAKS